MSGYRHLYYIDPRANAVRTITQGQWQVDTSCFGVDETNQLVYFMGTKDTPLESHLYVASYQAGASLDNVKRLTEAGFYHSVTLDVQNGLFVTIHSNSTTKPAVAVFKIAQNTSIDSIATQKLFNIIVKFPRVDSAFTLVYPEIFSFQNSLGNSFNKISHLQVILCMVLCTNLLIMILIRNTQQSFRCMVDLTFSWYPTTTIL